KRLQQIVEVLTSTYALIIVVVIFSFKRIGFVVVEEDAHSFNSALARNLKYLFSNDALSVRKPCATEEYDKRWQHATLLVLYGTSMEADAGNGVLTARVRASADLDFY